jgi:hypothetical protein
MTVVLKQTDFAGRRASPFLLATIFFFVAAHRLPAPISEAPAPTPEPAATAKAKPKSKPVVNPNSKQQAEGKNKSTNTFFAGTWSGTVISSFQTDDGKTVTSPSSYWVTLSNDGRIVNANFDVAPDEIRSPIIRNGMTLTWSGRPRNPSVPLSTSSTCTLQINSATTATFTATRVIINGFLKGTTYKYLGTLTKE